MKQILAAVDGSPQSLAAARQALTLALKFDAKLALLCVATPVASPGEPPFGTLPGLEEALLGRAKSEVEKVWLALGQPDGVERLTLMGAPAEGICDTAQARKADLIVVGHKGRGAIARVLVGSVAERVVRLAHQAVLVVR